MRWSLGVCLLPLALACDRPAAAESLPEWKPVDHHSGDDDRSGESRGQAAQAPRGPSQARGNAGEVDELVELAWRQQCVKCHGAIGRGDGPMGPMLHAHDLSDPAWQSRASDADIAAVIKSGKDKMPKFDLPEPVVQGLVARIRKMRGQP